jgi:predicted transcriptional regulator
MDAAIETSSKPALPVLPFAELVAAVGDPTRWAILAELSAGEPRMVKELAQKLGRSPSLISKHLKMLQRAGMVATGRGRLWQIPKEFLASPDKGHVDFGHCLLRLPESQ